LGPAWNAVKLVAYFVLGKNSRLHRAPCREFLQLIFKISFPTKDTKKIL